MAVGDCDVYGWPYHSIYADGGQYHNGTFHAGSGSKWLPKLSFAAGEEKVFHTAFNFNVDEFSRRRDWSVTAWGTSHENFSVTHSNNIASAHSPTWDDNQRSEPDELAPYPEPPPQICWDSNFGAHDVDGP